MVARSATRRGRRSTSPAASRTRQCLPAGGPLAKQHRFKVGSVGRHGGSDHGSARRSNSWLPYVRGPSFPRPLELLPPRLSCVTR
jgi:hypothetical protein